MPFLTVVVTTTGLAEVYYTLLVAREQMRPMDEIVIASTVKSPATRQVVLDVFGLRGTFFEINEGWVEEAEAKAKAFVNGIRVIHLRDGELLLPGALEWLRDLANDYHTETLKFKDKEVISRVPTKKATKIVEVDGYITTNPWYSVQQGIDFNRSIPAATT